jgi:hypothetical protein
LISRQGDSEIAISDIKSLKSRRKWAFLLRLAHWAKDRSREMSADERRALRQAGALPILARMKPRFEEVRPTLRPTSKLAEAMGYVLNRGEAFVRYISDGRIPMDNNVIERLLRPVAVGRQNFLLFGSENGGKTAATLYTLVQSAWRNCVDVWPYLTDVLHRLPAIAVNDTAALEVLLPDRWDAAHILFVATE